MLGEAYGSRLAVAAGCALALALAAPLLSSCDEDPPPGGEAAVPDAAVAEAETEVVDAGAAVPAGRAAQIKVVIGTVEVRRAQKGEWSPVQSGDELRTDDAIRTGEEARLEIDYQNIKIRVHERSELTMGPLSEKSVRGRLRGRLDTEVTVGLGDVVEIQAEGSDAVARTEGGAFAMTSDGQGVVAVGTSRGSSSLTAEGSSVRIEEGMVSRVHGKGAPRKPSKALRKVLLSVAWPQQDETNQKLYPVAGQVEVGSRVLVGGQEIPVDPRGGFKADVPLKMGKQRVGVQVTDVFGRKKRAQRRVLYDPTAPDVRLKNKPWSR